MLGRNDVCDAKKPMCNEEDRETSYRQSVRQGSDLHEWLTQAPNALVWCS